MRYAIFYKLNLILTDGRTLPIVVATNDINNVEPLVEKEKMFYSVKGTPIERFTIEGTAYGALMDPHQYRSECDFVDIWDEENCDRPAVEY